MLRTKGKGFARVAARLRARNRRFARLARRDQRIAIARDVIGQLAAGKLIATSCYLRMGVEDPAKMANPRWRWTDLERERATYRRAYDRATERGVDVSIVTAQVRCEVCGIGSLFVAAVENADGLPIPEFSDEVRRTTVRDVQVRYLSRWFDKRQLDLVEAYFELGRRPYDGRSPIAGCVSKAQRLVMIMENIISNRGRFDPTCGKHSIPITGV